MKDCNVTKQLKGYLGHNQTALLSDLAKLVAIPSVRDESTRTENAPFGLAIRQAFDALIAMAKREGFTVLDHEGYALDITYGEGEEDIALLHHIDVVSEGDVSKWRTPPYQLTQEGDLLFGRGVTDNKGPLVASFYILKMIKELKLPVNKRVRLIVGGAEETTWECVEHYFKHNPQPKYGFSPDGDFPIVNGEKGIIYGSFIKDFPSESNDQDPSLMISISSERDRSSTCHNLEVEFTGKKGAQLANEMAHVASIYQSKECSRVLFETPWEKSRNPHRVNNCIDQFVQELRDVDHLDRRTNEVVSLLDTLFTNSWDAKKLGLYHVDEEMGSTTCCVSSLNMDQHQYNLDFDFRFPKGLTVEQARTQLHLLARQFGVSFVEHQYLPLSYLSPEDPLIRAMGNAYQSVTGTEAKCFSKGAASYARALEHGVAFGPTFPGDVTFVHEPNEQLSLESLIKSITIYVNVLISL